MTTFSYHPQLQDCPICFETLNDYHIWHEKCSSSSRDHVICFDCLSKLSFQRIRDGLDFPITLKCPECRHVSYLNPSQRLTPGLSPEAFMTSLKVNLTYVIVHLGLTALEIIAWKESKINPVCFMIFLGCSAIENSSYSYYLALAAFESFKKQLTFSLDFSILFKFLVLFALFENVTGEDFERTTPFRQKKQTYWAFASQFVFYLLLAYQAHLGDLSDLEKILLIESRGMCPLIQNPWTLSLSKLPAHILLSTLPTILIAVWQSLTSDKKLDSLEAIKSALKSGQIQILSHLDAIELEETEELAPLGPQDALQEVWL